MTEQQLVVKDLQAMREALYARITALDTVIALYTDNSLQQVAEGKADSKSVLVAQPVMTAQANVAAPKTIKDCTVHYLGKRPNGATTQELVDALRAMGAQVKNANTIYGVLQKHRDLFWRDKDKQVWRMNNDKQEKLAM